MRRRKRKFALACVYDTETTNVMIDARSGREVKEVNAENISHIEHHAFPILFIENDIRNVDLRKYDATSDKIHFYRNTGEFISRIAEYIEWGLFTKEVPIICAYNLMFDLQPLMYELNARYDIKANAQSSTNVYTLDLYERDSDRMLLRFWDTYHLEMNGLAAMGRMCGLKKASGEWNYSLVRTQATELTDTELHYAARDVQVIPAYLRHLLESNEWLQQRDFGNVVLTKTSLVRQMARREIGTRTIRKSNGKKLTLDYAFMKQCKAELASDYQCYALRKACFRGGYTFTAARTCGVVVSNVYSLDVTSMHHTFINGRYVPQNFRKCMPKLLNEHCKLILGTSMEHVLGNYAKPFEVAIHARIRFYDVRLRKGTVFERDGLALETTSKTKSSNATIVDFEGGENQAAQDNENLARGWHDSAVNATCALGKVYAADVLTCHFSELELWTFAQVYEFSRFEAILGEATSSFKRPPDYIALQSNKLYRQKDAAKRVLSSMTDGVPYRGSLDAIPSGLADALREGDVSSDFVSHWYTGTVKGQFNGIYGTQAQDQYKPSYKCVAGNLEVDETQVTTPDNFEERQPESTRVLYPYGLRIVGGSRMHMVISMMLLHSAFGDKITITGGDTDSMKVACADGIGPKELASALKPMLDSSTNAISDAEHRLRRQFPDLASELEGVGGFEVENEEPYAFHIELWNKCRVSVTKELAFHVTCAGLPRPENETHIENVLAALCGNDVERVAFVLVNALGYDTFVTHDISHTLEHSRRGAECRFEGTITDYKGVTEHVSEYESIALYAAGRALGDTQKLGNAQTRNYLIKHYGRDVSKGETWLQCENGTAQIVRGGEVIADGRIFA